MALMRTMDLATARKWQLSRYDIGVAGTSVGIWIPLLSTIGYLLNNVRSTDKDYFSDIVAAEEELARSKVLEKILDVPVLKHSLQPESRLRLKFNGIRLNDVVPVSGRLRPCILGVEER